MNRTNVVAVAALAGSLLFFAVARADTAITGSQVQNGGVLTTDPVLIIDGTNASFTLENDASLTSAQAIVVGNDSTGTLTVESGSQAVLSSLGSFNNPTAAGQYNPAGPLYAGTLQVGYNAGSSGTVNIDGVGATLSAEGWFPAQTDIGGDGTGNLSIMGGGQLNGEYVYVGGGLTTRNASGTVLISGSGSSLSADLLVVGSNGTGSVTVTNGGLLNDDGTVIGDNNSGTMTIAGVGTQLQTVNLFVGGGAPINPAGHDGSGTLNITDGATVSAAGLGNGYIQLGSGFGSMGSITVSGPGSELSAANTVSIGETINGQAGVGNLSISDSASAVFAGSVRFGSSSSTLTISSPFGATGGSLTAQSLDISENPGGFHFYDGTLTINGGTFTVGTGQPLKIDGIAAPAANPTLIFTGSTAAMSPAVDIYAGDQHNGSLVIENGAQISNGTAYIASTSVNSIGSVTVGSATDTANSGWSLSGDLNIGGAIGGFGTLTIGPLGSVSVTGQTTLYAGSLLSLNGGSLSTGALDVSQNTIGFGFASGTVTVTGGQLKLAANQALSVDGTSPLLYLVGAGTSISAAPSINVGFSRQGRLVITGGAQVVPAAGASVNIGTIPDSSGELDVSYGGQLSTTGPITIGVNGSAAFNIINGGSATTGAATIGAFEDGQTDSVTVSGTGTNNAPSTWNLGSNSLNLSYGTLTITNGGVVNSGNSRVGTNTVESSNSVTIGLANSLPAYWNIQGNLQLGGSSQADSVTINPSGNLTTTGTISFLPFGTLLTINGGTLTTGNFDDSYSTLNFNGGTVTINGTLSLPSSTLSIDGSSANAVPTLVLNGPSAATTPISNLIVGNQHNGALTIQNGAQLTISSPQVDQEIGMNAGSAGAVTVDGAGSQLISGAGLIVGDNGSGSLTISGGGYVSVSSAYIGYGQQPTAPTTNTVVVTGVGTGGMRSTWQINNNLAIGVNQPANVAIDRGGQINDSAGFIVNGSVTVGSSSGPAATWTNSAALYVGVDIGFDHPGPSSLTLNSTGQVSSSFVHVYSQGTLNINGGSLQTGALSFDGGSVAGFALPTSGPSLSPLVSVGTLNLPGVGGNAPGTLFINVLNSASVSIAAGQVYDLVNYTTGPVSSGGAAASGFIIGTQAPAGLSWQIESTGSQLDLAVAADPNALRSYNGAPYVFSNNTNYSLTQTVGSNSSQGNSYAGIVSLPVDQGGGSTTSNPGSGVGPMLGNDGSAGGGTSGSPLYAAIDAGSNSGNFTGGSANVTMTWRNRSSQESSAGEGGTPSSTLLGGTNTSLVSNVVSLTGMGTNGNSRTYSNPNNVAYFGSAAVTENQADSFVLQTNYDAALTANEATDAAEGKIQLAWLAPAGFGGLTSPAWQSAVNGNFNLSTGDEDGSAGNDAFTNFPGSFAAFVEYEETQHPSDFPGDPTADALTGDELNDLLGSSGVDIGNHDVWAVLNHNSEFSVVSPNSSMPAVPEPSTLALFGLCLAGFAARACWRSRRRIAPA